MASWSEEWDAKNRISGGEYLNATPRSWPVASPRMELVIFLNLTHHMRQQCHKKKKKSGISLADCFCQQAVLQTTGKQKGQGRLDLVPHRSDAVFPLEHPACLKHPPPVV